MVNAIKVVIILATLLVIATIAGWDDIEWPFYSGLVLLLIAYVWSRASLVAVAFERTLDTDRVFAGDMVRERFRLTNRSRIPKNWIAIRDHSSMPGYDPSRSVRIASGGVTAFTSNIRAEHRGRFRLGPVVLTSGDAFGLFDSHRSIDQTHELIAYPKLVDLPDRSAIAGVLSGATRRTPGRVVASPMIRSVRQYVTGDPLNHIAWRSSARHGSLLVKEFDPDPVSDEWILLDLSGSSSRVIRAATEYGVSLAASFALEWLDMGRDVGLLVNRTIPAVIDADAGDRQRLKILETLAVVEPFGEADPAALIGRFAGKFSRATGLVIISTGDGSQFRDPLRHLLHQGVPLLVIAILPDGSGSHDDDWTEVESLGIPVTRLTAEGERVVSSSTLVGDSVSA